MYGSSSASSDFNNNNLVASGAAYRAWPSPLRVTYNGADTCLCMQEKSVTLVNCIGLAHLLPTPCLLPPSDRAPCVEGSLPSRLLEMDRSNALLPMRAPEERLPLSRCSCSPVLPSDDTVRADLSACLRRKMSNAA